MVDRGIIWKPASIHRRSHRLFWIDHRGCTKENKPALDGWIFSFWFLHTHTHFRGFHISMGVRLESWGVHAEVPPFEVYHFRLRPEHRGVDTKGFYAKMWDLLSLLFISALLSTAIVYIICLVALKKVKNRNEQAKTSCLSHLIAISRGGGCYNADIVWMTQFGPIRMVRKTMVSG